MTRIQKMRPIFSTLILGASYMTMNNEFYKILSEEISAKIEAEGDRMILRDPALDEERQIEQISEMLDMGIDVLILTPVNWENLTVVLERAKSQGLLSENIFWNSMIWQMILS